MVLKKGPWKDQTDRIACASELHCCLKTTDHTPVSHRELFSFLCFVCPWSQRIIFKDVSISVSRNFIKRGKWIADILQDWPGWQQDSENVG